MGDAPRHAFGFDDRHQHRGDTGSAPRTRHLRLVRETRRIASAEKFEAARCPDWRFDRALLGWSAQLVSRKRAGGLAAGMC